MNAFVKKFLPSSIGLALAMANLGVIASDFGNLGIIKAPSARFSPDATLSATISFDEVADIYNISYQATPWLEATFRYSIFDPRSERAVARDVNRDRSYEVKARLLRETPAFPQVAVGDRKSVV